MRIITTCMVMVLSSVAGMLFFAIHHEWILFRFPRSAHIASTAHTMTKRTVCIEYWKQGAALHENREIIWSENQLQRATRMISTYWSVLEAEGLTRNQISVQTTTADQYGTTLICSLSHSPFDPESSAHDAWHMVEGLLRTLHTACPQFQHLILLINQKPLIHEQLDFSQPWPLIGFLETKTISPPSPTLTAHNTSNNPIIIIHPAGDAHSPGRTIGDAFERTITLQMTHAVKEYIAQHNMHVQVLITRSPGAHLEALDNARFANRMHATIYISLHAYHTTHVTTELYLYTFRLHPTTDLWPRQQHEYTLIPYQHAHFNSCKTSTNYTHALYQYIKQSSCTAVVPYYAAFPYAPLIGIQIPALAIEMGLHEPQDIQQLVAPVATSLLQSIGVQP